MERDVGIEKIYSDYKKMKNYQNQIIGVVSVDKAKRLGMLEALKSDIETSGLSTISIRELQDGVITGNAKVVDKLKELPSKFDNEHAEGLLSVVGIYDNRRMNELTSFEQKKFSMICAFASRTDVLVMEDLYEEASEDEQKKLDEILIEFSVSKIILLTATKESYIRSICDRIINL